MKVKVIFNELLRHYRGSEMHVSKISVKNFRLLSDTELFLESNYTVIMGRNNCGKTSLTELFRRLITRDRNPTFRLEDFSLRCHESFWEAFKKKHTQDDDAGVRAACPMIEVKVTISYDAAAASLGPLGDFVIDLDPSCTEAIALFRYQLGDGATNSLLGGIDYKPEAQESDQKEKLCSEMRKRIPKHYEAAVFAVDPNDPSNMKSVPYPKFRSLLNCGFIHAQRGLDDVTHEERDVLGKILETLVKAATSDFAMPEDKTVAENLSTAVQGLQTGIDGQFKSQLESLLPAFTTFGYPGLNDPGLRTETAIDVGRLLTNHTKITYRGLNGVNLPESYNGLGVRNLILILLRLYELYKLYVSQADACGIQLVFIEEPEVHLHPQMQEVFVSKLGEIATKFAQANNSKLWPVQFVVTTHSSHVANRASFDSMRYFLSVQDPSPAVTRMTAIKNIKRGLGASSNQEVEFLHKYLTLTRCDLFFADKAILIEGSTERLMLPQMIRKADAIDPGKPQLSSQYISIVEVGGAYAHLFFGLVSFLRIPTLIITDLDAVSADGKKCEVALGHGTSNACLKKWFQKDDITPAELIAKDIAAKISEGRRLAFQIPEQPNGPCGRSFEDAFALANPGLFELNGLAGADLGKAAYNAAASVSKKTDFALKHLLETTDWKVPLYIHEGLRWLAETDTVPVAPNGGNHA
jgi:predicted ATP-dependent endonuclease of OLD family